MITIEQAIIKGLLFSEPYATKVVPHLKQDFFDGAIKEFYTIYSSLFEKYNKVPTLEAIVLTAKNASLAENVYEDLMSEITIAIEHRKEPIDPDWLSDETQSYCADKAIFNAIYKSIGILEGSDKKHEKHAIPQLLEEALAVSFDESLGMDYLDDWQRRFAYYTNPQSRLPFPLKALNMLSGGGLPPKTLNVILAGTNTGKSALMVYLAAEWMKAGKNVLYITLEMSEEAIQERVDANLLDVTTDQLKRTDLDHAWFSEKINKLKSQTVGKLIVKEYPTSGGHAGHFRYFLKELKQKKKFKPDVIFVDYINICASSRYKAGSGANSYTMVKSIAEELRGLACEENVPIVTATQTTRGGSTEQAPDMTATSESFGLPQTADWMIALVTNEELMEAKQQIASLLKTRYTNKSTASRQLIGVDFDKMRYSDVSDDDNIDSMKGAGSSAKEKFSQPEKPFGSKPKHSGIPSDINWDEE